jgi:predicted RNA-binding Zn ribbon-like protein
MNAVKYGDAVHWEEVSGLRMPRRVAGHPALDFCNTWAGWGAPPNPRREWLPHYEHLAVWALHAGLVPEDVCEELRRLEERATEAAAEVLGQAHEFRTALHAVLHGSSHSAGPEAFATVAAYAERAASASSFVPAVPAQDDGTTDGPVDAPVARWEIPARTGLAMPLLAVANAAAALMTAPGRARIDACPGDDCGWLFLNPRGRRRWCSMSSCGNRTKVRAHARRRREGSRD